MQPDLFDTKSNILSGLNPEQKKAVVHTKGPLLIIAGAGTGKTTVITRRIAYLIEKKICKPNEILALTFTEKSASEMEERVDQLTPYGFTDMWISTFHAFGDRILRDHSLDLGLPANFSVLTKTEQAIFMRQNLFAFDLNHYRPISNPTSHISALLNHFSRLKDELISPEYYQNYAQNLAKDPSLTDPDEAEKRLELANAYKRYQELLIQSGCLDFGDQIYMVYKLLLENKKILENYQNKFKFILVDEYQDTNYAQNEIVKLIAGKYQNLTVVGDDDQSIYRFRGASISNILQFKETFPEFTQIVLNKNYRSTQQILNASYQLIQHNNPDRLEYQNKIDKKLISPKTGPEPELLFCDTLSCEADAVVDKIIDLKKQNDYQNKDFAILVRANSHAEPFIQALNLKGLPYIFSGASNLYMQPEIKMLVAFLKTITYTDDNLSFHELATSELYNLEPRDLASYYTEARRKNRSIFEIIENQEEISKKELNILTHDIKEYQDMTQKLDTGELLYQYLTQKGYLKKLSTNPDIEKEIKVKNIARFFDRISEFNHSSNNKSVIAFIESLEMLLEFGEEIVQSEIDPDINAVNILTAHASKGLEWPAVFVVNAVSDRFPSKKKKDPIDIPQELIKERLPEGDFHLQEERRLFYVAVTRAKDYLFLSAAQDYGGKRARKISQFCLELLNENNAEKLKKKLSSFEKIERFKKVETKPIKAGALPKPTKLSRAQIDDYFSCPKKYYYAHIIRLPFMENHQLMYGTAIHAALDHYLKRKIEGKELKLEVLLEDYKKAFRNIGFITREHEDQRFQNGLKTLTQFFLKDQEENQTPKEVESYFEFDQGGTTVCGRFDTIYQDKEIAEIRDFKTSQVTDQKDADRRIKDSTQMKIYALAWLEKYGTIPKTTLIFIESGLRGERVYSQKEIDTTKEMINTVTSGLKANVFDPKPDFKNCKWCAYKDICQEAN